MARQGDGLSLKTCLFINTPASGNFTSRCAYAFGSLNITNKTTRYVNVRHFLMSCFHRYTKLAPLEKSNYSLGDVSHDKCRCGYAIGSLNKTNKTTRYVYVTRLFEELLPWVHTQLAPLPPWEKQVQSRQHIWWQMQVSLCDWVTKHNENNFETLVCDLLLMSYFHRILQLARDLCTGTRKPMNPVPHINTHRC